MMATISAIGAIDSSESTPPAPPSRTTKPPNTASIVCPASMLAKSRTERLIGRVRNEMTSIGTSRIRRYQGAFGTKSLRKPKPCLTKPVTMTVRMTSEARENVTAIWLVTVNEPGIMPKKLLNSTKTKIVKTKGKKRRPSSPVEDCIMLATNSYDISAIDWVREGTSGLMANCSIGFMATSLILLVVLGRGRGMSRDLGVQLACRAHHVADSRYCAQHEKHHYEERPRVNAKVAEEPVQ